MAKKESTPWRYKSIFLGLENKTWSEYQMYNWASYHLSHNKTVEGKHVSRANMFHDVGCDKVCEARLSARILKEEGCLISSLPFFALPLFSFFPFQFSPHKHCVIPGIIHPPFHHQARPIAPLGVHTCLETSSSPLPWGICEVFCFVLFLCLFISCMPSKMHPFFCARNKNCLRVGGKRRKPEEVVMTRTLDTWMLYGREGFLLKCGSYEVCWNLTWCNPCLSCLSLVSVIQEVKMPVIIMRCPLPQRKLLGTELLISCLLYLPPIFIPHTLPHRNKGKIRENLLSFQILVIQIVKGSTE